MKPIYIVLLLCAALLSCRENSSKPDQADFSMDYTGTWKGQSVIKGFGPTNSEPDLYMWIFTFSKDSRFSISISGDSLTKPEYIEGTWKGAESYIELRPDTAGRHFFPFFDAVHTESGHMWPIFITDQGGSYNFMVGCCDNSGSDHNVVVSKQAQQVVAPDR